MQLGYGLKVCPFFFCEFIDRIDTDPYDARRIYVTLADKLLKWIPGRHRAVMHKWPKWNPQNSPPVPGGLYSNPKWKPPPELTKPKAPALPKTAAPEVPAIQPPARSESPEGPTLMEQPIPDPPAKDQTLAIPDVKAPKPLNLPQDSVKAPLAVGGLPVADRVKSDVLIGPIKPDGPPTKSKLGDILPIPAIKEPPKQEVVESDDVVSTVSEESSLDLSVAMAGLEGIRQDVPTIEGTAEAILTPGGMAKHLATMGGTSHLL